LTAEVTQRPLDRCFGDIRIRIEAARIPDDLVYEFAGQRQYLPWAAAKAGASDNVIAEAGANDWVGFEGGDKIPVLAEFVCHFPQLTNSTDSLGRPNVRSEPKVARRADPAYDSHTSILLPARMAQLGRSILRGWTSLAEDIQRARDVRIGGECDGICGHWRQLYVQAEGSLLRGPGGEPNARKGDECNCFKRSTIYLLADAVLAALAAVEESVA
jgi:hypothetical protein